MAKEILTGTHPGLQGVPVRVAPTVGSEFNLVRAFLIPKACFKLEDAHFKFDSSFITPDGFDIAPLKTLLDKHPGTKLSIFGHADPTGDDAYNKTLSGRRAKAVFGLLTRDVAMWEKLHNTPAGGDNWKPEAEQTMRATTGLPASTARATLIKAYMDHLCTVRDAAGQPGAKVELTKDDFLARGKGPDGKGDLQGCSEFNPLMIFSKSEKATLDQPANRAKRNEENQVNRRVMVLLFRPGSLVDPNKWPCPTVEEGTAKCFKRFHSDGEKRRSNQADRREFKDTKDTFACRFYDRISNSSPCETPVPPSRCEYWTQDHVVEIDTQDDRYTVSSQIGAARTKYRFGGNLASGNITITFVLKWGTIGGTVTDAMKTAVKSALQTKVTAAWSDKGSVKVTDPVCGEKTLPVKYQILWNPDDTTDAEHFSVDLEKEPRRSSVAFPRFTLDHDADLDDDAWTLKHEFGHGFGAQDEYFYSGVTAATIDYKRADGTSERITLEPAATLMQTRGDLTVAKRFLYFTEIEAQKLFRDKSGRTVTCKVE